MIDNLMAIEVEVADDEGFVRKTCVIAGDMDFHGGILSEKRRGAVHFHLHARLDFYEGERGITRISLW
jgi:hypothetical protein